MNTLDLIVCLVLALAVWNGWRQGFVVQICSLAGIVAGIWIAARFGAQVGGWLRLKYLLVLSVLFSAFDALNEDYCLVGPRTIEQSKSYKPVRWLSESIFPFLEWVGERVPRQEEKTETDG